MWIELTKDHPRIRGEHIRRLSTDGRTGGSSPHTRGALRTGVGRSTGRRIIPAYAGSTPPSIPRIRSMRDHPRIRGEHVQMNRAIADGSGSSPHTRGAPLEACERIRPRGIIPAYAGSTSRKPPGRGRRWDHPRIRGEHHKPLHVDRAHQGSSPHTRGAPDSASTTSDSSRIIPAYAGSTFQTFMADIAERGSSPHTRGALAPGDHVGVGSGIIPAYAGSTQPVHDPGRPADGSSPHTRGALSQEIGVVDARRIIPAYAGSTRRRRSDSPSGGDHPRIRGEHRPDDGLECDLDGSSPHTRGAP